MANKRITELPAITLLNSSDVLLIGKTTTDNKITAPNLRSYVLSSKTIGGASAGDITTNNGVQTLTNKTLTSPEIDGGNSTGTTLLNNTIIEPDIMSPKINDTAVITVNGTAINRVCATSASTSLLNRIVGLTNNAQNQLNLRVQKLQVGLPVSWTYGAEIQTSQAGTINISSSSIMTALGISTSIRRIKFIGIVIQVFNKAYTLIYPAVTCTTFNSLGDSAVSNIEITGLDPELVHFVSVQFHLLAYSVGT